MTALNEDKVKLPSALLEYLRRIGAEVLNFRRAMVKEHRGNYYVERTLINIKKDGTLEIKGNKAHEPTTEEAEAIKAALVDFVFPTSIGASESDAKHYIKTYSNAHGFEAKNFYVIRDRRSKKIAMIQERRPQDDGGKIFIPHTLWSDGIWRAQEPEGLLPFWKPAESQKVRIMVHEGAKAAAFVDWMLNDRSPEAKEAKEAHPWSDELESYEHWGMLGGALAPHRADYSEIKREQPIEVLYCCDNDFPGRSVLRDFSYHYNGPLKGIRFDHRFKESFDLADPMPEKLFKTAKGVKRWVGPAMKSLVVAATHATETMERPSEGGKKKAGPMAHTLRRAFREEWVHVVSPEVFIHRDWPHRALNMAEFNSTVRPFSGVDDTARLVRMDAAQKATRMHYVPGSPSGFFGDNTTGQFINTYCPSPIKPEEGDVTPFLDFLDMFIVDEEDRLEAIRWIATLIAKPQVKMLYGLLLISESQGIGKGTLGEKILAPIIGVENVSYPSESDVVESAFNSWMAHKRLAVVHEIYAGQSAKAYNKLKSIITDKYVTVNKKHQATYELENWMHIIACSNSTRALKLSVDDRRWFVPKITDEIQPSSYWIDLNHWLENEGGLGIIMNWAQKWALNNKTVLAGERAPDSSFKREMIDENMSPGMTLVAHALDEWKAGMNGEAIFTTDLALIDIIKYKIYDGKNSDRLEKPLTIRKLAKARGWHVGETKTTLWEPRTGNARIVATSAELARADPLAIKRNSKEPKTIKDLP